jgi:membrane protein DedA with SNARE-associated domain
MHLPPAAITAWCGIIGGDCMLYHFGKKYGLNITRVPFIGKHVTRKRIERAERLFAGYGLWVVGIGRMFAGIRGGMVVAAGTIRYNFVKFIIADGLAAIISGGLFMALGYWGGRTIGDPAKIIEWIEPYKFRVMSGLVLIVIAVVAYIWWRRTRHKTLGDVVVERAEKVAEKIQPAPEHGETGQQRAVDPSK